MRSFGHPDRNPAAMGGVKWRELVSHLISNFSFFN